MRRNGFAGVALQRRSSWCIALAVAALAATPAARAIDSMGTEFLVAFPEIVSADPDTRVQTLLITSAVATSGTVENATLGINLPFVTAPGTVALVTLPPSAQLLVNDTVEAKGILVSADDPIAVYGFNRRPFATDGFLALPVPALGTAYTLSTWGPGIGIGSQLTVVGTADGTNLTVTPSVTTSGHPAGVPFAIAIDRGDTYYLRDDLGDQEDLTGTTLLADRPVAVFGSHTCATVPDQPTLGCNPTIEQILPNEAWGLEFLTVPFAERDAGDVVRVLAGQDDTEVRFDGTLVATLNAGQTHDAVRTATTWITSSAPVLVTQLAQGSDTDLPDYDVGDPFKTLVVPTTLYRSSYAVAVPSFADPGDWLDYFNLVVPSSAVGSVTLDGVAVGAAAFTPIGSSGWAAAQVPTSPGSHEVAADRPFAVSVYGFGSGDAYGYPAGTDSFRAPDVQAIPALSTWGLVALAALLTAGALLLLQRGRA